VDSLKNNALSVKECYVREMDYVFWWPCVLSNY